MAKSVRYHINPETQKPNQCKAKVKCKYAIDSQEPHHFETKQEAQKHVEKELANKTETSGDLFGGTSRQKKTINSDGEKLTKKNGVMVVEGKIKSGDFVKGFSTKEGIQSYYDGSWEDLEALTKKHFNNNEPGTGSVDGDVLLVNVPTKDFYSSIVDITPENRKSVKEIDYVRVEGEEPVKMTIVEGAKKQPARFVQIVVYRADVLAQDNDRSTDAEWEIVSVNAQLDKVTPMHPTTMKRNNDHSEGGTYREYSDKEWSDAYEYWENHAYAIE